MLYKNTEKNMKILQENKINFTLNEDKSILFVNERNLNLTEEIKINTKYQLVSKKFQESRKIKINDSDILDFSELMMITGPCSIKDETSLLAVAKECKKLGFKYFRAGAYKPRTSPHDFQGFEAQGLNILKKVKEQYGLKIVSEIMDANDIAAFDSIVDIYQVGARNMQNFTLLKALGNTQNTILLKRGLSATMEEFVLAAEYIIAHGNPNVILCERGIRTFETHTRNTLDLSVISFVKQNTNLPIIIDPSHGCGKRDYIESLTYASISCGCDGLIIESDIDPDQTNTDIEQTISLKSLNEMKPTIKKLCTVFGKKYGTN